MTIPAEDIELLRAEHKALERALRIRIWNDRKAWGEKDDAAIRKVNAEIEAIKTDARAALTNTETEHGE